MSGVTRSQAWVVCMCIPTATLILAFLLLSGGALSHPSTWMAATFLYLIWALVALASQRLFRGDASLAQAWVFFAFLCCVVWGIAACAVLFLAAIMTAKWILGLNALCALAIVAGIFLFRGLGGHISAVDSEVESRAPAFSALSDACAVAKLRLARAQLDSATKSRVKLMVDHFSTLPRTTEIVRSTIHQLRETVGEDGSINTGNLATLEEWIQLKKRL